MTILTPHFLNGMCEVNGCLFLNEVRMQALMRKYVSVGLTLCPQHKISFVYFSTNIGAIYSFIHTIFKYETGNDFAYRSGIVWINVS